MSADSSTSSRQARPKKVTQKEIARKANVSQALVSLALSGASDSDISEESRQRIVAVAQELGYPLKRFHSARTERKVFALVHPTIERVEPYPDEFFDSLENFYLRNELYLRAAAKAQGYMLISHSLDNPADLTRWLSEWDVKGVFWNNVNSQIAGWVRERLPLVQIQRRLLSKTDAVLSNQQEFMEQAVDHLYQLGHRRIGYIGNVPVHDYRNQQRLLGYEQLMEGYGLEPFVLSSLIGESTPAGRIVEDIRSGAIPVTAVIGSDIVVLFLQKELLKLGYRLPDDMSLVGIDNISACSLTYPELTSLDGCYEQVAMEAVALMQTRIREPDAPYRKVEISPRLIVRNSTTKPASRPLYAKA